MLSRLLKMMMMMMMMMMFISHHDGVQSFHLTTLNPQPQQRYTISNVPQLDNCNRHHRSSTRVTSSRILVPSQSKVVLNGQRDSFSRSDEKISSSSNDSNNWIARNLRKTTVSVLLCVSILSGGIVAGNGNVDPSMIANAATDPSKIVGCLFQKCSVQLGKCIASPLCLANVVCINTCNNRPDEIECQIKCGDIFDNPAIAEFNKCAVSDMSCVPQQPDDGSYPVPSRDVTVPKFNTNFFNGRLYISAGTNRGDPFSVIRLSLSI